MKHLLLPLLLLAVPARAQFSPSQNAAIDTAKAVGQAQARAGRASQEADWETAAAAYRELLYLRPKRYRTAYADSLLQAAQHSGNPETLGTAYLTAGIVHYDLKEHEPALDAYLKAEKYLSAGSDAYSKYKLRYAIAQTKYYLGFYHEAVALLEPCLAYFEAASTRGYLNTLHSLGLCYAKLGRVGDSESLNRLGLEKSAASGIDAMVPYFKHSQGLNLYLRGRHPECIAALEAVLPELEERGDFANAAAAHSYLGRSHWALGNRDTALAYFEKVHAVFLSRGYSRPDFRAHYETVLAHRTASGSLEEQLEAVTRLQAVDAYLNRNYRHLSRRIAKEFDSRELTASRDALLRALERERLWHRAAIWALASGVVALAYFWKRQAAANRRKFEALLDPPPPAPQELKPRVARSIDGLPAHTVDEALRRLASFELSRQYLLQDLTLIHLASVMHTNPKYASRIILHHAGKRPSDYVADLKVDYLVERLRSERRFRNFTQDAMAAEAGFRNASALKEAFKRRHGTSPVLFVKELRAREA